MKIAVLSYFSGTWERGAENWAAQLSSFLKPNHDIKVFGSQAGENMVTYTLRILKQLSDFQVVIPINGRWQVFLTRIYCWIFGKKMIAVGHSGRGIDDRINLLCFPDVFVGLSQQASNWAKKVNPFVKVEHIPNGVDLQIFSPKGLKAKIDLLKPVILAIGALEKNKQLDMTIKAVSLTPYSLVILGGGELRDQLQNLGDQLMPGRFKLLKVPFAQVSNYCRAVDVFTLASWTRESYALVYLEAMACNLPIVATDDLVRHEIIEDAGLFMDPHDTLAYAAALKEAVAKRWGKTPRLQAEKFSWDKIALKYSQLFDSICSQ